MKPGLSKNPHTLTRFILTEQQKYPSAKGDLSIVLNSIALAVKVISTAAKGAGIFYRFGLKRTIEEQKVNDSQSGLLSDNEDDITTVSPKAKAKKIDEFAHETLLNALSWCGTVGMVASQSRKQPIILKPNKDETEFVPKYCVVYDPLDGTQNIDANASVGTIFGIYKIQDPKNPNMKTDLLQPGNKLICSGYALYGDATVLMLTFGETVNGFTLDPQIGEFVLTHRNIRIPENGKIYSVNEAYYEQWDEVTKNYIHSCKQQQHPQNTQKKEFTKPYKARYIGCMVADVHRTLLYGGIFLYPATKNNEKGKLGVVYECNPLSFLVEAAGGIASDGKQRILQIQPIDIHHKSPIYIGSKRDVLEIEVLYKRAKQ